MHIVLLISCGLAAYSALLPPTAVPRVLLGRGVHLNSALPITT